MHTRMTSIALHAALVTALLSAMPTATPGQQRAALGPADGAGLPPLDTSRVAVGTVAPDFTLESKDGGTVTLSQFREKRAVVLVFYRGHW